MKYVYKIGLFTVILLAALFLANMYEFAQGVKEDALDKASEIDTKDSIKLDKSKYLHMERVE